MFLTKKDKEKANKALLASGMVSNGIKEVVKQAVRPPKYHGRGPSNGSPTGQGTSVEVSNFPYAEN